MQKVNLLAAALSRGSPNTTAKMTAAGFAITMEANQVENQQAAEHDAATT